MFRTSMFVLILATVALGALWALSIHPAVADESADASHPAAACTVEQGQTCSMGGSAAQSVSCDPTRCDPSTCDQASCPAPCARQAQTCDRSECPRMATESR